MPSEHAVGAQGQEDSHPRHASPYSVLGWGGGYVNTLLADVGMKKSDRLRIRETVARNVRPSQCLGTSVRPTAVLS